MAHGALIIPQCAYIFQLVRQRLASRRIALLGRFLPRLGPLSFVVSGLFLFVPVRRWILRPAAAFAARQSQFPRAYSTPKEGRPESWVTTPRRCYSRSKTPSKSGEGISQSRACRIGIALIPKMQGSYATYRITRSNYRMFRVNALKIQRYSAAVRAGANSIWAIFDIACATSSRSVRNFSKRSDAR